MVELEKDSSSVAEYLSRGTIDRTSSSVARAIKVRAKNYHMHDGDLYRRTAKGLRFVPGEKERISIMKGLKDEIGHWSFAKTYKIISDRFWWPKIRVDAAHFVRSWESCQKTNPAEQNGPYGRMPVSGLFHTWSIDFAGPLRETTAGNKSILVAIENLSSWPVSKAIGTNSSNSSGVIKFVEEQTCQLYGNPRRILSDGDPKFDSAAVRDYAAGALIEWKIISAYNPRGNATVERMVGTLKRAVQKALVSNKDRDWDDCLGEILVGYRRRPGTDGKSPFEVLLGIRPRFAVESPELEPIAFNMNVAREFEVAIAKSLSASRIVPTAPENRTNKFEVGEKVLVRRGRKETGSKIESTNWIGPFIIKEENHPRYKLRTNDRRKFRRPVHARRPRLYVERGYGPNAGTICWYRYVTSFSVEHTNEY